MTTKKTKTRTKKEETDLQLEINKLVRANAKKN